MLLAAARLEWLSSLDGADELVVVAMWLVFGEALEPAEPVGAVELEAAVAASASSSTEAEAELVECVLLCLSCEKCLAIEDELEEEKSF